MLDSRPRESGSAVFLSELQVPFKCPPGSALLDGTLPLRYCAARFASKFPTWCVPPGGGVADLVDERGERRLVLLMFLVVLRLTGLTGLVGVKRVQPNRKTPAHRVRKCFVWTPHQPVRAQTHIFLERTSQCTIHTLIRTCPLLLHWHWLKVKGICVSKTIFHLVVMPLCNVLFVRFPSVASSPICSLSRPSASSTSLERSRINPCASAHWSGMSGCLANATPHTGYEPNFHTYRNEEYTPINLPDSHRNFPRRDATIITTAEDPGASSSSKQTEASRVPTMLGSLGNSFWKQWRDHESVDSRNGIQETGANLDRESVVSAIFSSQSKGKRDRDQNVVHSLGDGKSPQNP